MVSHLRTSGGLAGVLHHMCLCFRAAPDSLTDRLALMDYETRRLLSAIVKSVAQMTAEDLEPVDEENGYDISIPSLLSHVNS